MTFRATFAAHGFLLLGHIDHAAAAFADFLAQLVAANPVARLFRHWHEARWASRLLGQKALGGFVGLEQGLHSRQQGHVPPTGALQEREPFRGRRCIERLLEQRLLARDLVSRVHRVESSFLSSNAPCRGGFGPGICHNVFFNSSCSQARA